MKKYTAQITIDGNTVAYEIEDEKAQFQTAQEFHKHLILKVIDYPTEEILSITDEQDQEVFRLNKGF
mgnify:CR=1 FL=1